jgi:hypothetical protein
MRRSVERLAVSSLALVLAGCATPVMTSHGGRVARTGWALLPLQNFSEAPQADERVRAVLATVLRSRGLQEVRESPQRRLDPVPELDPVRRTAAAVAWARAEGLTFGITGSVNEWRYRGSPEGWPAVGLTLTVLDVQTGKVVWTSSGALAGGSGEAASGTAQRLLESLLASLEID